MNEFPGDANKKRKRNICSAGMGTVRNLRTYNDLPRDAQKNEEKISALQEWA